MNDDATFRPDFHQLKHRQRDARSPQQILSHYLLERRLAEKLRTASAANRTVLYTQVYNELFSSLPDHPQRTREKSKAADNIRPHEALLHDVLSRDAAFLEIGCGDAALSFWAASKVRNVYGVDVTDALIDYDRAPSNFRFVRTSGTDFPMNENSVDLAYSNQLMEHLHPDDAESQLHEIRRVLKPNGQYWCRTPSRITGPHDVSCYFGYTANGFHLREYDYASIRTLFKRAGFRAVRFYITPKNRKVYIPYWLGRATEVFLETAPRRLHDRLIRSRIVDTLAGLTVLGIK